MDMLGLGSFTILYMFWLMILIATHISLSIIVYKDAKTLKRPALRINPVLWCSISFSMPILGMFVYWVMNYSTVSQRESRKYGGTEYE